MIYVGCCGFPKGRAACFQHFPLVEVQQTFYKPPRPETARRWRQEAPPDFIFTLKAWQLVTHPPTSPTYRRSGLSIPPDQRDRYGGFRPTPEVLEAWERTREVALALEAPIVVFQCPATFTPTPENIAAMRQFFSTVGRAGMRFAWEPRGPWEDETVAALCRDLDLIHCVDPFVRQPVTSGVAYFRLHGVGGYRYRFTDADLLRVLEWCRPFETAYVLFNNISMWEDGLRLQSQLLLTSRESPETSP
ncbi:MAG: DUF72 domain-containing protein [Anaerolineae bacterium]|nr:DUF72 domain-containing protein [Anaerolineae bacterium]